MAQADADRNRMTQQNRQQHGVTAGNVPSSGSGSSELRLRSEMRKAGSSSSTSNSKKPRFKPFGDPAKAKAYREEKQRQVLQDVSNATAQSEAALTCEGSSCYEVVDVVNNQDVTTDLAPNGLSAEIDIEQQN